jgi:hypothetical protein
MMRCKLGKKKKRKKRRIMEGNWEKKWWDL